MPAYRIVFAGTPDFAACALEALIKSEHEVVAVYTQPDRPAGRGQKLLASPVKILAQQYQLPIEQPVSFKQLDDIQRLNSYRPDILVVAAYGLILPQAVLDLPALACLNIHASLLPRWRGAAPIQHAILAGDAETGISIMAMNAGLDTGDVLLEKRLPIEDHDTGQSLHDKLAALGAVAMNEALQNFELLFAQRKPQDNQQASYAHKIGKSDARINWASSVEKIDRMVRAYNSWPVSFTQIDEQLIRIWSATVESGKHTFKCGEIVETDNHAIKVACADGFINILQLQLPGKKALTSREVLNAHKALFAPGKCFV